METYRQTLGRLSGVQKTVKGAPAYSRYVNRQLGRYVAAWAFHTRLRPNHLTAISGSLSALGILVIALARPTPWSGGAIALLLAVGYAFDAADGQLARLRGGGTPVGEWLDHVVDSAKICALHLAVLVSFYRFGDPDPRLLLIPLAWTFVATVSFFVIILNDQIRRSHGRGATAQLHASAVRSILVAPTDYGVLLVSFVVFGWTALFTGVYALLLLANVLFLILALVKWYREIAAFQPGGSPLA